MGKATSHTGYRCQFGRSPGLLRSLTQIQGSVICGDRLAPLRQPADPPATVGPTYLRPTITNQNPKHSRFIFTSINLYLPLTKQPIYKQ